jgi:hypothetical protein
VDVTKPGAILMAALALPGVAQAENAPEQGSISIKYLDYQERQSNLKRIGVRSPSVDLLVPIAGQWALRASVVSDAVSGASPRYHTAVSGASHFKEKRTGVDLSLTRYLARASVTVAVGSSDEYDYDSRFGSVQATFSSDDNNTTWLVGAGLARDKIDPVNLAVVDERKRTVDMMAGVTQVLTPRDVVQVVLAHVRGRGYFSHPYKYVDSRPRERDQDSVLLRWNHHLAAADATARMSYRYTSDSYAVRSHTLSGELVKPLAGGWTLTPSLRLYTQSQASFYFDPVYDARFGPPFPPGFSFSQPRDLTADQRMSAFGAATLGLKVAKQLGKHTTLDVKWEEYRQRSSWRQFGSGSPGLRPFQARSIQLGLTRTW